MDGLPLEFPEKPEKQKHRGKRLRPRKVELATGQVFHKPEALPVLLRAPQQRICGFCGHRETVEGDVALCSHCRAVIVRDGQ